MHPSSTPCQRSRLGLFPGLALGLALAAPLLGCAVPAIDPSGERIFSGAATRFGIDWASCPLLYQHRGDGAVAQPPCNPPAITPVATQPPVVAPPAAVVVVPAAPAAAVQPCAAPVAEPPQACGKPSCAPVDPPGPKLLVTPCQIVVPVCSEVVLTAGICGPDGYYIMRQPIEWTVNPEGVGHFTTAGRESYFNVSNLLRGTPKKVAPNFIRSSSAVISQTIDRGTVDPTDDIHVSKGQAWVSVTSPAEGVSYVTVYAPQEERWPDRKATARIYWVDAVWAFPAPSFARLGGGQRLTTIVKRSGGAPVAGWIVRYDFVGGPAATFGATQGQSIEVATDRNGEAFADLTHRDSSPGASSVRVQIIRPAAGNAPQMVVGQGTTSVTWSAPGLRVSAVGPPVMPADGVLSYQVEVANTGDQPARGVQLLLELPAGFQVLNTQPQSEVFGTRYRWSLGDIPGRRATRVQVNARSTLPGTDVRLRFRAEGAGGLASEEVVASKVLQRSLAVSVKGPEAANVGEKATFQVTVRNIGDQPLRGVTLVDTFREGLQHSAGLPSPITRSLGELQPGEARDDIGLSFVVTRPGAQTHFLEVTAEGGQSATAKATLTGVAIPAATPPRLQLRPAAPKEIAVDGSGVVSVEVANVGGSAASQVQIEALYDAALAPQQASQGHEHNPERRAFTWKLPQLAVGQTVTRKIEFSGQTALEGARVTFRVTADRLPAQSAVAATRVSEALRPTPMPAPTPMPPLAAGGNLKIDLVQTANPISQGQATKYVIDISNDSDAGDEEISVVIRYDDQALRYERFRSPDAGVAVGGVSNGEIVLQTIRFVRAREQLPRLEFELSGLRPGKTDVQVVVASKRNPKPLTAGVKTQVNMRP